MTRRCFWEGCKKPARRGKRWCTTHCHQHRARLPRKPCIVAGCENLAMVNSPACSTHYRRKAENGGYMIRRCRSCDAKIELDDDVIGGPLLCDDCFKTSRLCEEPGCGCKANKNTTRCNKHFRRKTTGPWRKALRP